MINQTITLNLGGKERTLLFGVNGYYSYIKESTKQDPFDWLLSFDKKREESTSDLITVIVDDVVVLVYAGINCYLDSLDQDNIPFEKVRKWCNAISPETSAEVFKVAFGTMSSDKPGELTPQAAQENGKQNA